MYMKTFFLSFFTILSIFQLNATNYYISNSGDDNALGTSPSEAWQTIDQLNTVNYVAGDTVFFQCGGIFRGTIIVNQGGSSSQKVVFTSYGTGNKPIISGSELITGWTLNGDRYEASFNQLVTSFFVNDNEQTIARYPNDHQYLWLDSAQTSYLKDASLPGLSSTLVNGKVCVHTAQWCWEKSAITSFVGDKINFTSLLTLASLPDYAYFLFDDSSHLDTIGEWYYDGTNNIISYISSIDPNTLSCEASVYSNGFQFGTFASNIIISNLAFENQTNSGIQMDVNTNRYIVIDNCDFNRQYNHGINDKGRYNEIKNCSFRGTGGIAVFVNGSGRNTTIHHNVFRNIGPFRNHGIGTQINLSAISCAFVDSCYIHHNDIDSTGYCGISADGGYHVVERNIIKNAMLLNNDGAALKSYGGTSHHITFQNNFVSESNGNTEGKDPQDFTFLTPGIYFDFNVNNCLVKQNTIYNRSNKGIFMNSGTNTNTINENVIYGFNYGLDFNGSPAQPTPMTGMEVKHNYFFAKDVDGLPIKIIDNTSGYNQGEIDSNYYFQPYNTSQFAMLPPSNIISYDDWLSTTGFDTNSKTSFVNWTLPTSLDTLIMNQTDDIVTIDLGTSKYLDLDSNEVCESISLQPYTSIILINTGQICESNSLTNLSHDSSFRVFPNPSSTAITIQTADVHPTEYSILNQAGQVIITGNLINGTVKVSIEQLVIGFYFIQLKDTGIQKFVKN